MVSTNVEDVSAAFLSAAVVFRSLATAQHRVGSQLFNPTADIWQGILHCHGARRSAARPSAKFPGGTAADRHEIRHQDHTLIKGCGVGRTCAGLIARQNAPTPTKIAYYTRTVGLIYSLV